MSRCLKYMVLVLTLSGFVSPVLGVGTWTLELPETVVVTDGLVTLGDVAAGPVPAQVRDLVVRAGLEPNTVVTVSRQDILRRLVTAGLARGVRISGADMSQVVFKGTPLEHADLYEKVNRVMQELVPPSQPGAPDSWFDLDLPEINLSTTGSWNAVLERTDLLTPGRNLVRVGIENGDHSESFQVAVDLHVFGEVGRLRTAVPKNKPLDEAMFDWEWRDLAKIDSGLAVDRGAIQGASTTRALQTGAFLRQADLRETPIIMAGDLVQLQVQRGQVFVTVKAFARQNGCLGQTIPVRSEMTGRLVNARVAGPGLVEWRN